MELRRRSRIPWNEEPNQAPCMSWRTCGRAYELIEYDDTQAPWTELRRFAALEVSSTGVKWSREFEELARGNKIQKSECTDDRSNEHPREQTWVCDPPGDVTREL